MLYPTPCFVAENIQTLQLFADQMSRAYRHEILWNSDRFQAASGKSVIHALMNQERSAQLQDTENIKLSGLLVPLHRKFFRQLLEKAKNLPFCDIHDGQINITLPRGFILALCVSYDAPDIPGDYLCDHVVLNYSMNELCEFEFRLEQLFGTNCTNQFSVGQQPRSLDFSLFYFQRLGLDFMLGAVRSDATNLLNHIGLRVCTDWERYLYYIRCVAKILKLEQRDKTRKIELMLDANPELRQLGESFYNDLLASTAEVSAFNKPDAGYPELDLKQTVRVKPGNQLMLYSQFFPQQSTIAGAFELVARMTVEEQYLVYNNSNAFWQMIGSERQYKPLLDLLG